MSIHVLSFTNDPRIKFAESEKGDIPSNLNSGINSSAGEFVARMDHDDEVVLGRFMTQINFLRSNPDTGIVGTYLEYICPHGLTIGLQNYPALVQRSLSGLCIPQVAHPSVMMTRTLLQSVSGYSDRYLLNEDLDLWQRATRVSKIRNIPETLLRYRLHPNQVSRSRTELQRTNFWLAVINDARRHFSLKGLEVEKMNLIPIDEFLALAPNLLKGLPLRARLMLHGKIQEDWINRNLATLAHSETFRKLLGKLLRGTFSGEELKAISKNWLGVASIFTSRLLRRLKDTTPTGRAIIRERNKITTICSECNQDS